MTTKREFMTEVTQALHHWGFDATFWEEQGDIEIVTPIGQRITLTATIEKV